MRWTGVERAFALQAGDLLGLGDGVFLLSADRLFAALRRRRATRRSRGSACRLRTIPLAAAAARVHRRADRPGRLGRRPRPPHRCLCGAGFRVDEQPTPQPEGAVITGVPGVLGVVEGVVRRLDRLDDQALLLPGEVLVTRLTNIGWTPVFPRAAAIVTDLGAPLSHAAIVARELRVPAVVGCGDATARLRTGDRVRVDGAHGTVELLSPERA